MSMTQILGAVAMVIGLVLLGFAYQASNAPMEQVSDALTGRYTNQTMWYLIVGIAAAVGGVLLVAFGRRK
jgi:LPXTG-motif cell wall-anchored protein